MLLTLLQKVLVLVAVGGTPAPGEFPFARAEAELSEAIGVEELKAHVYRLASPEFLGRKGPGAARAGRHVATAFERLKLQPLFGDSFYQDIRLTDKDSKDAKEGFAGRNVGAVLPGTDPKLRDEWVLLSAHFDHLGERNGKLHPGADDNASGMAMLLEVAERFALQKAKPRRTIVIVAFDLEEAGLVGSQFFAAHPPRDLKRLKAFLTADMIGRSMAGLMDDYVYALGSESSDRLKQLVGEVKPAAGLKVGRIGADLIGTRSDYGPFRDRKIPFLFFSTGQHPDYHKPTDLPERIDYVKLQKISQWIGDVTWRLVNDDEAPAWREKGDPELEEVRVVHELIARVLKSKDTFRLNEKQRALVESVEKRLAGILASKKYTPEDRNWLVWTARLMMSSVF
jgi:hypothetical protein